MRHSMRLALCYIRGQSPTARHDPTAMSVPPYCCLKGSKAETFATEEILVDGIQRMTILSNGEHKEIPYRSVGTNIYARYLGGKQIPKL